MLLTADLITILLVMAGLEELKKKLVPLFDAEKGFSSGSTLDPSDSYLVSFSLEESFLLQKEDFFQNMFC